VLIAGLGHALVVMVITVFAYPPSGFTAAVDRWTHHLLDFLDPLSVAAMHFRLGDTAEELIPALAPATGDAIDLPQQIVGEIELDLGHLASIGRGFG
jgi:hypothetical protein